MKFLKLVLATLGFTLAASTAHAKINNPKTVTVKILGNCEMCKQRIEKAGNLKNEASVVWHEKTDEATITYDTIKTTYDDVLKRIAYAGYDNEKYVAPDEAYAKLPGCCQYERTLSPVKTAMASSKSNSNAMDMGNSNTAMSSNKMEMKDDKKGVDATSAFSEKYNEWLNEYLQIKNALVTDNASAASVSSSRFMEYTIALPMGKMNTQQHTVWMEVFDKIKSDASAIYSTKDIAKQRKFFQSLSANVSVVVKEFKLSDKTVYQQYCPMYDDGKGAYWISEQSKIKNPYYGKAMSGCGSTKQTINTNQ
jgi:hypothetical protein